MYKLSGREIPDAIDGGYWRLLFRAGLSSRPSDNDYHLSIGLPSRPDAEASVLPDPSNMRDLEGRLERHIEAVHKLDRLMESIHEAASLIDGFTTERELLRRRLKSRMLALEADRSGHHNIRLIISQLAGEKGAIEQALAVAGTQNEASVGRLQADEVALESQLTGFSSITDATVDSVLLGTRQRQIHVHCVEEIQRHCEGWEREVDAQRAARRQKLDRFFSTRRTPDASAAALPPPG